jgi:hypothetical protein
MSDFLMYLASRALGREMEVRPRPASIFEPSDQPRMPAATRDDQALDSQPSIRLGAPAETSTAIGSTPLPRIESEAVPTARNPSTPVVNEERVVAPPIDRRVVSPDGDAVRVAPSVRADETVRIPTPATSVRRVVVDERRTVETTVKREQTIREESTVRRGDRGDLAVRRGEPTLPQTSMQPRRATIDADRGAPPEPPFTVEVTIGRVEVRSIQPPAAARPASPAPRTPSLSLNDYLKERSRGRE